MSRVVIMHGSSDLYGASRVLLGDVEAVVDAGNEVVVLLPAEGPLRPRLEAAGATVKVEDLTVLRRVSVARALKLPLSFPLELRADDVVVLWTIALLPYLPLLAVRRQPAFVSVHEILDDVLGRTLARVIALSQWPVMVNSRATERWMCNNGVDSRRLYLAYPAAPARRLTVTRRRNGDPVRALIVGRLNGFKGQSDVIHALDAVRDTGHSIELDIVGGPFPGQEAHAEEIKRLSAERAWVSYLGELDDVEATVDRCDVLVIATRRPETFGIVALEAWARGKRCIAPFEGGAAEAAALVDGVTFEPRDVRSLARAIKTVIDNERLLGPPSPSAKVVDVCTQARRLDVWQLMLDRSHDAARATSAPLPARGDTRRA